MSIFTPSGATTMHAEALLPGKVAEHCSPLVSGDSFFSPLRMYTQAFAIALGNCLISTCKLFSMLFFSPLSCWEGE